MSESISELAVLPLRDVVVYPHMVIPLFVGRDKSIRALERAMEAGKQVKKLPMSLGDALAHLAKDEVVQRGMPGEMYRLYDEYKQDEWARFMSTVTEWDKERYMDCLP